jgi:hypothetical protein
MIRFLATIPAPILLILAQAIVSAFLLTSYLMENNMMIVNLRILQIIRIMKLKKLNTFTDFQG